MDGTETRCLIVHPELMFRAFTPRRNTPQGLDVEDIRRRIDWSDDGTPLWPLGQEACFARGLAERYGTVHRTLRGLRAETQFHLRPGCVESLLSENSPWAAAHHTQYPIVQGPMTRVSDCPAFAAEVATAGGLPFLALGVQRAPELETLLTETEQRLGSRPWGVGMLGFLDTPLQDEQWAVVRKHRPPFALIAGGHPEQARLLEIGRAHV